MERATNLSQSIIKFLESASSAKKKIACCRCGAIMEQQKTTFFYECQKLERGTADLHPMQSVSHRTKA
jgi:hypothetical protein